MASAESRITATTLDRDASFNDASDGDGFHNATTSDDSTMQESEHGESDSANRCKVCHIWGENFGLEEGCRVCQDFLCDSPRDKNPCTKCGLLGDGFGQGKCIFCKDVCPICNRLGEDFGIGKCGSCYNDPIDVMPHLPKDPFWKLEPTHILINAAQLPPAEFFASLATTAFPGMQVAASAAEESGSDDDDNDEMSVRKVVPYAWDVGIANSRIGGWCKVKLRGYRVDGDCYVIEQQRRMGCCLCSMKFWEQMTSWVDRQTGAEEAADMADEGMPPITTFPCIDDHNVGEMLSDLVSVHPSEVALWLLSNGWAWIEKQATYDEIRGICAGLLHACRGCRGESSVPLPLMSWFLDGDLANTETQTKKKQLVLNIFCDAFSRGLLWEAAAALPLHVARVRNIAQQASNCMPSMEPSTMTARFEAEQVDAVE